jgi:HEAT repeat protein
MSIPEGSASPGLSGPADFARQLKSMMEAVHEGRTASDVLLRFARTHEQDTVRYCVHRMTEPDLSLIEEMMIARLLQQAGMVQQFVGALLSLDPQAAQGLARRLQNAERGLDLKIAPFLQSEDSSVVMHSLELLEVIAESKQIVPLLFSLVGSENPKIQSKAALIIQKLDSEQAYTRRLLQHPEARVRANALQGIADRANVQGAEFLLQGLADTDHRVRTLAAVGLSRLGDPQGFQVLLKMLRHPKPVERRSAAWGLGVCGNAAALPRLEALARGDADERVRELAAQACLKISERSQTAEKKE